MSGRSGGDYRGQEFMSGMRSMEMMGGGHDMMMGGPGPGSMRGDDRYHDVFSVNDDQYLRRIHLIIMINILADNVFN